MLIYILDVSNLNPDDNKWQQKVSKKRYDRTKKYLLKNDRSLSLGAELLLNYALKENFCIRTPVEFDKNKFGKPCLIDYPQINFSLSHSGCYSVCALSNVDVGIDIQFCKRIDLKIAKRFFSSIEYNYLMSVPLCERFDLFYEMWTLKESYVKAKGIGMSLNFDKFYIDMSKNMEVYCCGEKDDFFFKQYKIFDTSYKLSACSKSNSFPDEIKFIDINQL